MTQRDEAFESAAAVDQAEEIVAVDGVDMVLMGTNDLISNFDSNNGIQATDDGR